MENVYTEQEHFRIEKLEKIRALGIDPFPAASFDANTSVKTILTQYKEGKTEKEEVVLAGRLMSKRVMGSASFSDLEDATGRIQLYLKRDILCPGEDKTLYQVLFKKLLDIGDIVGVKGTPFVTKVGALAIQVTSLTLLTKSLKPLPAVKEVGEGEKKSTFYSFSNPELRYRQRYIDLIVNPDVRNIFEKRAKIIQTMRKYLDEKGYLEVETPILQPLYGGAAARPFTTYHHHLDMPLYLRISNELYLKRLIVGGYPGVYEFAKDFRNEGLSRFHNPEFTQVEFYVAYKDYHWMMDRVEELLRLVAIAIHDDTKVDTGEHVIDFGKPFKRYTMFQVIEHYTGIDISRMEETELRKTAQQLHIPLTPEAGKGKIIDEIFGEKCEPHLIQPTFIMDYPVEMSPLSKRHREHPNLVERFELICMGKEISNCFSELNDPLEQRERFEEQAKLGKRGDQEAMCVDEDFLRALRYGMPPTVGIGIGIDRLTMIMTGVSSIQEVIFFPQMRQEKTK